MRKVILWTLVTACVMSLILLGCSTSNQTNDEENTDYSESENTFAQEFVRKNSKEVANDIYNRLRTENIYCQYDGSDNVVYFKNSGYTLEERSWIEVDLPERIIFYNPDPNYLKIYFNSIVSLWDIETEGYQIVDELESRIYEDSNGYEYNIIEENNVEYHIYYSLKNSCKINHLYVYFKNNKIKNEE